MIWFTADTHFHHRNIVKLSSRPFASLEEMSETIIARWNERVGPGDVVYHLGDFALSWGNKDGPLIDGILQRLNGQKWLIRGNHDRKEVLTNPRWIKVLDYHELKVDLGSRVKQKIVLCHYPFLVWNGNHRGSWMLHGHCHGNLPDPGGKIIDVGVDCHDYAPLSLDALADWMAQRPIEVRDHHDFEAD